ncbi:hypothetical protein PQQ63_34180 [Paraburkholderia metrosideri]|uniref:Uncharacterized protein n=1 Tax=Paraburkholderia metrosideri TaxID=580937 RepID=A0ABW9E484_9BURK
MQGGDSEDNVLDGKFRQMEFEAICHRPRAATNLKIAIPILDTDAKASVESMKNTRLSSFTS